ALEQPMNEHERRRHAARAVGIPAPDDVSVDARFVEPEAVVDDGLIESFMMRRAPPGPTGFLGRVKGIDECFPALAVPRGFGDRRELDGCRALRRKHAVRVHPTERVKESRERDGPRQKSRTDACPW